MPEALVTSMVVLPLVVGATLAALIVHRRTKPRRPTAPRRNPQRARHALTVAAGGPADSSNAHGQQQPSTDAPTGACAETSPPAAAVPPAPRAVRGPAADEVSQPLTTGEGADAATRPPAMLPTSPADSAAPQAKTSASPPKVKPSVQADAFTIGALTVRAASVRGLGHRRAGDREDDYALATTSDGAVLIAAVADGVGSAPYAAEASWGVAHAAADVVAVAVEHEGIDQLAADPGPLVRHIALQQAGYIAARTDFDVPDFTSLGSTLVVMVMPTNPGPGARAVVIGVGDSPFAVLGSDNTWQVADLGRGPVHALPRSPHQFWTLAPAIDHNVLAVGIMSDGLSNPLGITKVRDWLAERWAKPPPGSTFVHDMTFECAPYIDDRTALMVWPHSPGDARGEW